MEEVKTPNFDFLSNITIADDEEIKAIERKREEEKKQAIKDKLENQYKFCSNVPSRYIGESLETYKPTPENKTAYEWICGFTEAVEKKQNTKNVLFLSGKFGTGKTHLACGMIRRLGGMIYTSLELCITYDSCRDFNSPQTRIQFLKHLCSQKVLVIDEIGKGVEKIEKEIMPYILNEFYGNGRILVFLGNCSKDDFEKIIGEAGADRMKEVGVCLTLTGESQRGKK